MLDPALGAVAAVLDPVLGAVAAVLDPLFDVTTDV